MAYYTALINAWNSVTQPPAGVTGTPLTGGMTTAQKITAVNGWTITGAIPTTIFVNGDQLANCVNWAEFAVLTAQQQQNLLGLFAIPGQLLGGSASTSFLPVGMILSSFTVTGPTIASLTALAKATITPWWQAPVANSGGGLSGPVSQADCTAAGLS